MNTLSLVQYITKKRIRTTVGDVDSRKNGEIILYKKMPQQMKVGAGSLKRTMQFIDYWRRIPPTENV